MVVNANTSAVAILLPAISEDVDAPLSTLQWAVTGYMLVGAAFIVTSGALGDVFGRRRTFIGGLILFIASCVLIALSSSGAGVVIGRGIQGAAGATIVAGGLSLLTVASSGNERLRAVVAVGCGIGDRGRRRPARRRRAGRVDRMAGPVLDRRRHRCRLHPPHLALARRVP